jgi:hypothetical protein
VYAARRRTGRLTGDSPRGSVETPNHISTWGNYPLNHGFMATIVPDRYNSILRYERGGETCGDHCGAAADPADDGAERGSGGGSWPNHTSRTAASHPGCHCPRGASLPRLSLCLPSAAASARERPQPDRLRQERLELLGRSGSRSRRRSEDAPSCDDASRDFSGPLYRGRIVGNGRLWRRCRCAEDPGPGLGHRWWACR